MIFLLNGRSKRLPWRSVRLLNACAYELNSFENCNEAIPLTGFETLSGVDSNPVRGRSRKRLLFQTN